MSEQSGQSNDSCSWLSMPVAAASVGSFSNVSTSCVSLARLTFFVFLPSNNKVYNRYRFTKVTIDTLMSKSSLMSSLQMLRVHVAPVGFEVDRIVLPAVGMKADKVWLITHSNPSVDMGNQFVSSIRDKLKQARIECLQTEADRTDLFDTLRALRIIILKEKANSILVNVSVGSKIQAIASMMACMMFKDTATIKPYYAVPERYTSSVAKEEKQETEGLKEIIGLPEYKIEIPSDKLIRCLDLINRKSAGKSGVRKRDLKDSAIEAGLIQEDEKRITNRMRTKEQYSEQAAYMSLNKNLIEPLQKYWRFITETKVGTHHIISLTDEGKNALHFLSAGI
jgi:Family of unknown function (DUF6293)